MRIGLGVALALALIFGSCAPAPALDERSHAHHVLRRFAFSASPTEVDAIVKRGVGAWLQEQLRPASIDDREAMQLLEPKPMRTNAKGDLDDAAIYARRLVQRQIFTQRQVQEKLTLHWIEHFSVGVAKVDDWALMARYEETLRSNALGNFRSLLVAVSKDPAMLIWLDNNYNDASDSRRPPNENFARELLQLYVMGTDRLNLDGSVVRGSDGRALSNYEQRDVRTLAAELAGWGVDCDDDAKVKNPSTRCHLAFHADENPGATSATLTHAIDRLVRNPSTAPFQARELLQRFVTETPSPAYVSDIAAVWRDNVDAPDQIARVVDAIVKHPEFERSYHGLIKEPEELFVDALRAIPTVIHSGKSDSGAVAPLSDLVGEGEGYLSECGQMPYDPPSVFSFYRPGHKAMLLSDSYAAARLRGLGALALADANDESANVAFAFDALEKRLDGATPSSAADYLIDALSDVETTTLRTDITASLSDGIDAAHLRDAVWLILTSPEYELN